MLRRGSVRPSIYPLRLLIYPLIEMFRSTLRRVSGLVSSIYDANKIDQRLTKKRHEWLPPFWLNTTTVTPRFLMVNTWTCLNMVIVRNWQRKFCRDLSLLHNFTVKMFWEKRSSNKFGHAERQMRPPPSSPPTAVPLRLPPRPTPPPPLAYWSQ